MAPKQQRSSHADPGMLLRYLERLRIFPFKYFVAGRFHPKATATAIENRRHDTNADSQNRRHHIFLLPCLPVARAGTPEHSVRITKASATRWCIFSFLALLRI